MLSLTDETMLLPLTALVLGRKARWFKPASHQKGSLAMTANPSDSAPQHHPSSASAVVRRPVLRAVEVHKSLPLSHERIDILKGISFEVHQGEVVAIVGPSGSGKSTLLGIIAGLDNPTSGQVLIDEIDITRMGEGHLAKVRNQKIGMVFQAFNLIPTLTAQENVEIPLYVGRHPGNTSKQAKELLALVGLSHRLGNRPTQLSGGEQQRVAVARALVTRPAIVIMDEPTGNLDQKNSENVLHVIRDLRTQTGTTFIIATHDPQVATAADRSIRIVDGLVAAETGEA
jgi:putative ABC transport system ATP-binding protein